MLGTISFWGITPIERPSSSLFLNQGERQKTSPERPDSFRARREIECEMESLLNGMDILGDSCVRLNLP
jgi:hypothetical protein